MIERALGRKAKLKRNDAIAVDAQQLRNAKYRVSGPNNRERLAARPSLNAIGSRCGHTAIVDSKVA